MGVPTLALTAGAVIAKLWTNSLTPLVEHVGVIIVQPPLNSLVAVVLTILPGLMLISRMPKVHSHMKRMVGSAVFAVLGVMLTYGAFANAVVLDSGSQKFVIQLLSYDTVIITTCIVLAFLEVFFQKRTKSGNSRK